ncbi:hypothetical protein GJ700_09795 [Duganella sp. FT92W]|uniref:Uncharacterized protein n=1 Tax=Pseudoduganella rivuli TaxID=2666085 RepID=A0A7X2ILA3_9BURK|nr:hypothetical protein [Pseudoduganella rivuli]MRV72004.1 hypothetical protein [Pseudoduganella rivuli]
MLKRAGRKRSNFIVLKTLDDSESRSRFCMCRRHPVEQVPGQQAVDFDFDALTQLVRDFLLLGKRNRKLAIGRRAFLPIDRHRIPHNSKGISA